MRCRILFMALWTAGLILAGCKGCSEANTVTTPGKAGMLWITMPGGSFSMGSWAGERDEQPVHRVTVASYGLSKTEVTVSQYQACVKAGACKAPDPGATAGSANLMFCNWGTDRADHPINCVDWMQARTFCAWAGGRLPSEAEWEYAARSGRRGWRYPWGDEQATCGRAMMNEGGTGCGQASTAKVCSSPAGNTVHGLCDMAGNVWEWVEDCWFDSYRGAPVDGSPMTQNCLPDYGRVLRGGSWGSYSRGLRAAVRSPYAQARKSNCGHNGFRCAKTSP